MPRSRMNVLVFALCGLAVGCKEVGARHDIQEGNKAYYDGKYDRAIQLYNDALAVQPDLAIGWFNLGLSHLALFAPGLKTPDNEKHAKGAIDALQKYLALETKDLQARDYLLSTYIDSGHYEGAIDWFEKKLERDPKDIEAVAQLAQINQQAGRYDEAIKWQRRRAEIVTTNDLKADSWYSIGVLDWRRLYQHTEVTGTDRVRIADEGIAWLQKADEVRKQHQATLSYLNLLYRERSKAHDASCATAVDMATAQVYYKAATDLIKKP